jgi:hypothetical protein
MEWRYPNSAQARTPTDSQSPSRHALLASVVVQLLWDLTDNLLCGCLLRQGMNTAARALTSTPFVYMKHG